MAHAVISKRASMSYDDYRTAVDEDTHSEWVDGEVTVFMPATPRHQAFKMLVAFVFAFFVEHHRLGRVLDAPLEMRLRSGRSYREPDILFVANSHLARLTDKRLDGPADLVVEILSEDDPNRDRIEKFAEYEAAGIAEYWLIEGRAGRSGVQLFARGDDGQFAEVLPDEDGRLHSRILPGLWLDPSWLAADRPRAIAECLAAVVPEAFGR